MIGWAGGGVASLSLRTSESRNCWVRGGEGVMEK